MSSTPFIPRTAQSMVLLVAGLLAGCRIDPAEVDDPGCGTSGQGCGESTSSGSGGTAPDTGTETDEPTDTDTDAPTGTDTTGPTSCAGPQDCVSPAAPYCSDEGVCVACDEAPMPELADAACAAADPLTPACAEGTCVTCTGDVTVVCDEQLQLCDTEANACVGCTEHGQCESGACQIAEGTCFPEETALVTVDGDAGSGADYGAIEDAVAAIEAGGFGVIVVGELDSAGTYQPGVGGFVVDGGRTIAMLAAEGERPVLQGTGANAGLRVSGAGTVVYLDELELNGANEHGLVVDGGFAWVDRSRIVENDGGGVLAQNMAEVTLRNCFVGLNGGEFADTRGATSVGSQLSILYTTVVANSGNGMSGPRSLACDAMTTGSVRNSIVAAGTATIDCSSVVFDNNVLDTGGLDGSNNVVLPFDPGWFPQIAAADLHIDAGPPFEGVALWQDGDPAVDIDGDLRPMDNGSPDYAGADVP